jgi:hypothetical protein
MEAAPRFELGIGVLQTPALPLGYAAKNYLRKRQIDRILNRLYIVCQRGACNADLRGYHNN